MFDRGRLVINPTPQLRALVDISRRGKGRRRVEATDARTLRLLLAAVTWGRYPRPDGPLGRRLLHDGVLVRPAQVPGEVHLNPRLARAAHMTHRGFPRLRDGTRVCRGPGLPPDIARHAAIPKPFLPAGDILWVRHAGSGIELPYTLMPELARELRRAGRGAPSTPLPDVLRAVGATGDPGDGARERAAWRRQVLDWRRELRTLGFVVLRDLFPPIFVAAVREYYRRIDREGYLLGGDARRRGRPLVHDEPLLAFLGGQLAAVVRQVTRERAPSTFSFLRFYDAGAVLARHRDHPVCRWNIDLVVGGEPAPKRGTAWPLWIDARPGRRAARLGLGDGVLYRATHLTHWRSAQPAGQSTVLACFHYGRGSSRA